MSIDDGLINCQPRPWLALLPRRPLHRSLHHRALNPRLDRNAENERLGRVGDELEKAPIVVSELGATIPAAREGELALMPPAGKDAV